MKTLDDLIARYRDAAAALASDRNKCAEGPALSTERAVRRPAKTPGPPWSRSQFRDFLQYYLPFIPDYDLSELQYAAAVALLLWTEARGRPPLWSARQLSEWIERVLDHKGHWLRQHEKQLYRAPEFALSLFLTPPDAQKARDIMDRGLEGVPAPIYRWVKRLVSETWGRLETFVFGFSAMAQVDRTAGRASVRGARRLSRLLGVTEITNRFLVYFTDPHFRCTHWEYAFERQRNYDARLVEGYSNGRDLQQDLGKGSNAQDAYTSCKNHHDVRAWQPSVDEKTLTFPRFLEVALRGYFGSEPYKQEEDSPRPSLFPVAFDSGMFRFILRTLGIDIQNHGMVVKVCATGGCKGRSYEPDSDSSCPLCGALFPLEVQSVRGEIIKNLPGRLRWKKVGTDLYKLVEEETPPERPPRAPDAPLDTQKAFQWAGQNCDPFGRELLGRLSAMDEPSVLANVCKLLTNQEPEPALWDEVFVLARGVPGCPKTRELFQTMFEERIRPVWSESFRNRRLLEKTARRLTGEVLLVGAAKRFRPGSFEGGFLERWRAGIHAGLPNPLDLLGPSRLDRGEELFRVAQHVPGCPKTRELFQTMFEERIRRALALTLRWNKFATTDDGAKTAEFVERLVTRDSRACCLLANLLDRKVNSDSWADGPASWAQRHLPMQQPDTQDPRAHLAKSYLQLFNWARHHLPQVAPATVEELVAMVDGIGRAWCAAQRESEPAGS